MSELLNGSHRSVVESPNGCQRSIAIGGPPWFFAGASGQLFILSTYSLYQVSVMLSNNDPAESESGLRGLGRLEVVVFRPCGRGAPGVSRWAGPSWSSASWPPRRATSC